MGKIFNIVILSLDSFDSFSIWEKFIQYIRSNRKGINNLFDDEAMKTKHNGCFIITSMDTLKQQASSVLLCSCWNKGTEQ